MKETKAQNHKKHKINVIKKQRKGGQGKNKANNAIFGGVCVTGHKGHKTISTPLNVQRVAATAGGV